MTAAAHDMREQLRERGIRLNKRRGQCLLKDDAVQDRIIATAELSLQDMVIDVGTGPGYTALQVAPQCGRYVGIEIDAGVYQMACDQTAELDNVYLVHADILKGKNKLNPVVVKELRFLAKDYNQEHIKLVANLPYNVATPVIMRFLLQNEIPVGMMVVMVQKEMGMRLTARVGNEPYGLLAVLTHAAADARMMFDVKPESFFPKPAVNSSVVRFQPYAAEDRPVRIEDLAVFEKFIKALFNFTRKQIWNALDKAHVTQLSKAELAEHLKELDIPTDTVLNQISPEDYIRLFNQLKEFI